MHELAIATLDLALQVEEQNARKCELFGPSTEMHNHLANAESLKRSLEILHRHHARWILWHPDGAAEA